MLELRAREVRLKRKIFSVAESRRRVVFTARPEDPGGTLDPGEKGVRRKTVRQSENVVRAAGPTHVGGVMAKCLWQSFTSIIGHKRGYLMSHIGHRQRCATYRGVRSHNAVSGPLSGRSPKWRRYVQVDCFRVVDDPDRISASERGRRSQRRS